MSNRIRGNVLVSTATLQTELNNIAKDINNKIRSDYGYRKIDLNDQSDISSSTPVLSADSKQRMGWKYVNSGGPTEALDLTLYDSTNEESFVLRNIESMWMEMSSDNADSSQEPYFLVTTALSTIEYKIDYPNVHIGHSEKCLFYHGLEPDIGDSDLRKVNMNKKTITSGTGGLEEAVLSIKLVSDSAALAGEVDVLLQRVGFETGKNSNISQSIARNIELTGFGQSEWCKNALWSAATPGVSGKSALFDTQNKPHVLLFGSVDAACTLTVENSNDGSTWFSGMNSYTALGATDFEISFTSAARYVRLNMDTAGVLVTALGSAK